jgi:AraC-like DNA-binding protein
MKGTSLNVIPSPAIRHHIRGAYHADAAVSSIEVLVHRRVSLKQWSLGAAANAYWRLYWPQSSGGYVTFQDTELPLEPGALYLISPHTAFHSRCSRPFAKWYLHFTAGGLPDTCRPGIVKLRPTARMRALLLRTCPKQSRSARAKAEESHPLESLELALLALRMALPEFQSSRSDARLARCVAYLHEHLRDKITLADLARFAGTSARTLAHLFAAELGFPPMRYLIELRLNHAMKLLRHTEHGIEKIAEECGFPNRYYLTRMLSKYRKTTPAEFRRRSAGEG